LSLVQTGFVVGVVGFWEFWGISYVEGGEHQPEKKDRLEEEVEGEPVEQDIRE
jgi:hypothetical protein